MPFSNDETADAIRGWLKGLGAEPARAGLEIVIEDNASIGARECAIPWNLVYDADPEEYHEAFRRGDDPERWRPFWGFRYNLTCGRRVEPLRRQARWAAPRVVVVVDPATYNHLDEEQRERLDTFVDEHKLKKVDSLDKLKQALGEGQPRLLYWLGHARPEYLRLGEREIITPRDLEDLLIRSAREDRSQGMLIFLNACRTAESGPEDGSFLAVMKHLDFCRGAILTERQTIDNFANKVG
jgi:hypothetical protein